MNSAASPLRAPSLLVMGWNDHGAGLEGWHELECDGRYGIPYRATTSAASLRLRLPTDSPGARTLWILLAGSPSLLGGGPMRGNIEIRPEHLPGIPATNSKAVSSGESRRMELALSRDCWRVYKIDVPSAWTGILRVWFRVETPVVPDRVLRNGDTRELGWYVSSAGFG